MPTTQEQWAMLNQLTILYNVIKGCHQKLDAFIDQHGIVVNFPMTLEQKIEAILQFCQELLVENEKLDN